MTRATRSPASLPDLLVRNALTHPDRLALADGSRAFDYRRLDTAAGLVAARLARLGTGRGDRVALLGPRDARMCVLLHGVLRAGAAAVLFDPEWSPGDTHRRLDAVTPRHVLTASPRSRVLERYRIEFVDVDALAASVSGPGGAEAEPPAGRACEPGDLAYLSFTSGSSGEPKAVAVTHANAVHYALALRDRLGLSASDAPRVAHVTTLAADLGHTSWLLALATAGSVHLVPDAHARDPEAFWAAMRKGDVSVLKTTPSHLTALLAGRPADAPALDSLLLGGEALPRSLATRLLRDGITARIANHYGPTETTVGATCFLASTVDDLPSDEPTVPIGTAIGEAVLRLVPGAASSATPAPEPVEGELYIGGEGVAAGYFGRPDATARAFVTHDGRRMYRTGDICRRRPDGDLVFVGRSDRQVKIRGYRVDPAEVERAIEEFPGVRQGAVIVRATPAGAQLLAAVRPTEGHDEDEILAALRSHLLDRLPGYSVPQPILALTDFPFGANGKLDRARLNDVVHGLIESRAVRGAAAPGDPGPTAGVTGPAVPDNRPVGTPALAHALCGLWADSLGLTAVDPHADVLALGGDSLLAMRTVSFLRRRGHRVAFEDFYAHPTPTLLATVAAASRPPRPRTVPADAEPRRLAPAQRWLFRQPVDDPRHWNQSVLLTCRARVRPDALARAVEAVLHRHPALRRTLGPGGPGRLRPAADVDAVSHSRLQEERSADVIGAVCTELHRSLDPEAGRLLRAHLFAGGPGVDDRVALIAHHLVVDGLSWRILLDDLAAAYRAALSGQPADLPPTADFYTWAAITPAPVTAPRVAPPLPVDDAASGTEPAALVWSLDEHATRRLVERHGRSRRLEALLLAAYADATLAWSGQPRLGVEVETHGRATDGDHARYLDTVGWFTAVKWLAVDATDGPRDPGGVEELVRRAPQLPMDTEGPRPEAAFNFLGSFRLPDEPSLGWSVAPEQAGAARCAGGDCLYRLRLTARIVDGRLVTDLVYAWPRLSHDSAERIFTRFTRAVAAAADAAPAPYTRAPVSTSGQLLHPGTTAAARRPRTTVREPVPVLLTGATGYLGGQVLGALVERGARVTCLVRGDGDAQAARRLGGADAVAGDITAEGLGLTPAGLARVREARVVVHTAADVRLVASPAELERTNHAAVRRLLHWIDGHTPDARFHHVSTLAVSGEVEDGPARRFSEADLRVGQSFRTPYERAKFRAEETVRSWAAAGGQAFVHRSGHIAAHSRTGAFQRNVADNRIYQTVRGYVLAGAAPSRPSTTFEFSHVDTVAAGIAALAVHPYAAPGVYHVETPHAVAHDELVAWTVQHGYPVRLTDDAGFAAALEEAERRHPAVARLASAWSQLGDRNVVVDSAWTRSVLDRLGVRFAEPTADWWSAALAWAADAGFLPCRSPVPAHPAR
ncbi:amino acid adenylation domain-containing protein [Streptomyces sp. NPDC007325]|uniref:amino acid adenylation domain-containing protein n=1 Tax=Streptomyces sp. NPDC007325 TaxID=3154588 RepID=UPI0033F0CC24